MKQVLAVGYYGCDNLGDDTMLWALHQRLAERDISVVATSGNPDATQRSLGIFGVPRRDLKLIRSTLMASDALVFGGGSIFQDTTSVRSTLYYWAVARLAARVGKPLILLGQGVGPLRHPFARRAFSAATVIAVRDPGSADLLRQIGVRRPIHVTADLALLCDVPANVSRSGVGLAPRPHHGNVAELFSALSSRLPNSKRFAMDRAHDSQFLTREDVHPATPTDLIAAIAGCEAMIAMRLHAGILAAHAGVPTVMLSYDPKVAAFARLAGLVCLERASDWNVDHVLQSLEQAREQGIRSDSVEALRHEARRNIDLLCECLD